MVELRYLQAVELCDTYMDGIQETRKVGAPALQYRVMTVNPDGHIPTNWSEVGWSEWQDIPTVTYALGEKSK